MHALSPFAVLLSLLCIASTPEAAGGVCASELASDAAPAPAGTWKARATDNICGFSDLRMVSNPATVRFDSLLKKTPEMKKLKRDRIEPDSPEGIQLRNQARKRVTTACEATRVTHSHCSVWRAIRNSDPEVKARDITALVEAKL